MKSINGSRKHCMDLLARQDRSSYILSSYIPQRARDSFVAVRAFNLETSKVDDSVGKPAVANLRFEFWKSSVQKALGTNTPAVPKEPVAQLLHHGFHHDNIALSKRYLLTLVQTREAYISNPPLRDIDEMCSYGEGTYSQLNYLTQEALYSVASQPVLDLLHANEELVKKLEEMVAHIGQATGITTFLRGLEFFAKKNRHVVLPVDVMAKHNVSQQSILDHFHNNAPLDPNLGDVVFETATRANDHILTARSILNEISGELGKLPDCMIIPALTSIPVQLYLERLEKHQFDISDKSLLKPEWKLPYRSYKAFKLGAI